jgi:hypothetical protein
MLMSILVNPNFFLSADDVLDENDGVLGSF